MNLQRFTFGKGKDANDAMTPERFDLTGAALVQMQDEVDGLTEIIGRILDGRDPNVRGATLAWLSASFIAEHGPTVRPYIAKTHIEAIRLFLPLAEAEAPTI